MGRIFHPEPQTAGPVGFHRELNMQVMSEFWLGMAAREHPELLSSTERPTLDTVLDMLRGVGWDAFWEQFPMELREQCVCLDEDSIDALSILFSSRRNRQRFQRHFCDTDDAAAETAAASAAAAEAPADMPAPRVGTVRSRAAAGLGLGSSAGGSGSSRRGSRRFEAVHEALTADDEDLVSIVLDLLGPCSCTQLASRVTTDRRLVTVAARRALPNPLVQSVTDQLAPAASACDVRLFSLEVGSGHSRSALAAAAALRVPGSHTLYVDLHGVFGEDDLDHALWAAIFTHGSTRDSTTSSMDAAADGTDTAADDRRACREDAVTTPGAHVPGGQVLYHTDHDRTSRGAEDRDAAGGHAPAAAAAAAAAAAGIEKAAAEQQGDGRHTAGTDQQHTRQQLRQGAAAGGPDERARDQDASAAADRGLHLGRSSAEGASVRMDTNNVQGGAPDTPSSGGTAVEDQQGALVSSRDVEGADRSLEAVAAGSSEAMDGLVHEDWGSAPELVWGLLKLLGCTCKAPLLIVLDEVDAAMAHEEGRAMRETLLKLLMLLPRARIMLTSSATCDLAAECGLLRLRRTQPLVLPDSCGVLRSFQARAAPSRSLMRAVWHFGCIMLLLTGNSPEADARQQPPAAAAPAGSSMSSDNGNGSLSYAAPQVASGKHKNKTEIGTVLKAPTVSEYNTTTVADSACCALLRGIGFNSTLPVLVLKAPGAKLTTQKNHAPGTMCTCGAPNGFDYDDVNVSFGERGSSSVVDYTKKSYNIGTKKGPKGQSSSIYFMGMPKDSSWYVYGPENDHAMSRNWMAYSMWRQTGRWGSRTVWAEVFLIVDDKPLGMEHYVGLYMAGEKISRAKYRVDIPKYDPSVDITGGFIFRIEHGKVHPFPQFETQLSQQTVLLDYPRSNVTQESLMWLTKYFNDFERELISPTSPPAYSKWATEASLVDYFLITEMIKGGDQYRGSVYFSKGPERPIEMGPVWDANSAMGICCGFPITGYQSGGNSNGISGGSAISTNGWLFDICVERSRCLIDPLNGIAQWYLALWKMPEFRGAALRRWVELRVDVLSDDWLAGEVARQAAMIQNATNRNYVRWAPDFITDNVPLEQPTWTQEFAASTKFLSDWLVGRARWIDSELAKEAAAVGVVLSAQNATATPLSAQNGSTTASPTAASVATNSVPGSTSAASGVVPLGPTMQPQPLLAASG